MHKLVFIAVLFLLFGINPVLYACYLPPKHMYVGHDETIDNAKWIARVRAIRRKGDSVEVRAIEYLKGDGPELFILPNVSTTHENNDSTKPSDSNYFGHSVSRFWVNGGRSFNSGDCSIHPSIMFGDNEYLIFGPLDYNLGFENITAQNDLWLKYVRDYLKGLKPSKPFPKLLETYIDEVAAVIRVQARWEGGRVIWEEEVLKGDKNSYINTIIPVPDAYFNYVANPNCHGILGVYRNKKKFDRLYILEHMPVGQVTINDTLLNCFSADGKAHAQISATGRFVKNGVAEFDLLNSDSELKPLYRRAFGTQIWRERISTINDFLEVISK